MRALVLFTGGNGRGPARPVRVVDHRRLARGDRAVGMLAATVGVVIGSEASES